MLVMLQQVPILVWLSVLLAHLMEIAHSETTLVMTQMMFVVIQMMFVVIQMMFVVIQMMLNLLKRMYMIQLKLNYVI